MNGLETQVQSHRKVFVELEIALSLLALHTIVKTRIEEDFRREVLVHFERERVFPLRLNA